MTNNVRINHEEKTIIITKAFSKAASKYNTNEYNQLVTMRKENEGYRVVVRSAPKRTSSTNNISLEDMRKYIKMHDDEEGTGMKAFEAKLAEEVDENCKRKNFFRIKKWFLEQYKEVKKNAA